MDPRTFITTPAVKQRYYLDFTTNGINGPVGGVTGNNAQFRCNIEHLTLDPNNKYTVEVVSFYYQNVEINPGVYPILLSDIGENIRVVNANSSFLFKSNVELFSNASVARDNTNNAVLKVPVQKNNISEINFEIVRSDDGQQIELPGAITITLLIKSVN